MKQKFKNLALLFVLLIGVLSNVFASNLVHDASKISIEKSAVGCGSIKAWGALSKSNLDDAFRRNVDYLDNISKHSTNNLPPNTFGRNDWAAFFAEHEDKGVKAWEIAAKHADNIKLDPNFLTKLSAHLDEFPNLKSDLNDIDVFKAYKEFADDKLLSYEILSNVDGNLAALVAQKVANSTSPSFWKYLIKGKYFEKDFLLPKFKDRFSQNVPAEYTMLKNKAASEFNGINLDGYDLYAQVQFNLPSPVTLPSGRVLDYFVADQVFIKWGKNADGVTDEIKDMVIIENKLSSGTNLTPPQNAGKASSSLTVRSNTLQAESIVSGIDLPKGATINNTKWLKAYDSENGDVLTNIIKL